MIFCTQLTFDLFLRLRSNYRLGIHPYVFCHISRNNTSMGRIMYSILPSKVKISVFFPMGLPTRMNISDQSETYRKGGYNVSQEAGTVDSYSNACNSVPLKSSEKQTNCTTEYQKNDTVYEGETQQTNIKDMSLQNEQSPEIHRPVFSK